MSLGNYRRIHLFQILVVTLFWLSCGVLLGIYKCVTYDISSGRFIFYIPWGLPMGRYLLINMIGPAIGGLLGGSVLILYLNRKLRASSYLRFLLVCGSFFFLVILSLNCLVSFTFYYKQSILSSNTPLAEALLLLFDPYAIRNILSWMVIAFFTLHGLRISEKYGPLTYIQLFMGTFHTPREVKRVFLFLDITDATTIAEQLGHQRYFALLQDFYSDITEPILDAKGQIYQYVGDEIIVAWTLNKRMCRDLRFLNCFFDIERAIRDKASVYFQKYGLVPVFKAALHSGSVVVGEIGIAKREIVYSGDIMNTTARILEQCKRYDQKLILSMHVLQITGDVVSRSFRLIPLGELVLRGKKMPIQLFGVQEGEYVRGSKEFIANAEEKDPD